MTDVQPIQRIPLTVIGGFLGAGKTSLLVHWLQQAQGKRIAVLVNDFGDINIDAELLRQSNSNTIALSNGCVCCEIGGDLSNALLKVLVDPAPFDAIVVEASGVSDPWPIAQIALADKRLQLNNVLVMVDASTVRVQANDPLLKDTLLRQLKSADLLVLNKTDLCTVDEIKDCQMWLRETLGDVSCITSQWGKLELQLLEAHWNPGESSHQAESQGRHLDTKTIHFHEQHAIQFQGHSQVFQSQSHLTTRIFDTQVLRSQLNDIPPCVIRLKGWVKTQEHGWSCIQYAGRHASVQRSKVTATEGQIVCIYLKNKASEGTVKKWITEIFG